MTPHKALALWIETTGKSRTAIAEELGVCRSAITCWCGGKRTPNPKSAKDIEFLSEHKVPAKIWGYSADSVRRGPQSLQQFMLREGITIHRLAGQLKVATTSARSWVNGDAVPNDANLAKLSKLLKVKLSTQDF